MEYYYRIKYLHKKNNIYIYIMSRSNTVFNKCQYNYNIQGQYVSICNNNNVPSTPILDMHSGMMHITSETQPITLPVIKSPVIANTKELFDNLGSFKMPTMNSIKSPVIAPTPSSINMQPLSMPTMNSIKSPVIANTKELFDNLGSFKMPTMNSIKSPVIAPTPSSINMQPLSMPTMNSIKSPVIANTKELFDNNKPEIKIDFNKIFQKELDEYKKANDVALEQLNKLSEAKKLVLQQATETAIKVAETNKTI